MPDPKPKLTLETLFDYYETMKKEIRKLYRVMPTVILGAQWTGNVGGEPIIQSELINLTTNAGGVVTVTFPQAFPNSVTSVVATISGTPGSITVRIETISLSQFTAHSFNSSGGNLASAVT